MESGNKKGDSMSTLVAVIATAIAIIMLFVDWRYSVLAVLVVWNQLIFKEHVEGMDVKFKYMASVLMIVVLSLYLLLG